MKIKYKIPYYVGFCEDEYLQSISLIESARELKIERVSNTFANEFVYHHHYLHRKVYIGKNVSYGAYYSGFCVGVCMFGYPVWTTYPNLCPPLTPSECPELLRLSTMDGLPRNSESYFVAKCMRMLVSDWEIETLVTPKVVTSFCDHSLGFDGALYKALNFVAFGKTKAGRYSNPNGKHGRWGDNDILESTPKTMFVYYL